MNVDLVILNYNGRGLLGQCLPSILEAASASGHDCRVVVIDNASTDGSVELLREAFPEVHIEQCPNHGLCSYNTVLKRLNCDVAVLLNNDIQLDRHAIDPLIEPFIQRGLNTGGRCFMTAAQCRSWDSGNYEGQKTAVTWRWGLVQATSLYHGHEHHTNRAGMTASAGAALAVDRQAFLQLGGFDPLYLPGRLEDLDLAFRAYQQGFVAEYVPQSLAFHAGQATFAREFGAEGCNRLALRNTLLFQWKNLRCLRHRFRQWGGCKLRIAKDVLTAPFLTQQHRWKFVRALIDARHRWREVGASAQSGSINFPRDIQRERNFFRDFHPKRIDRLPGFLPRQLVDLTPQQPSELLATEPLSFETV